MDSVATKIQETGQHVAKKSDVLLTRTREAGEAFFGEVREAGSELVALVRGEAKGWRKFLVQRTSLFENEARGLLTPKAIERSLLLTVDGALRGIQEGVQARLAKLGRRQRAPRRAMNGATRRPARKTRASQSAKASSSGATATAH